jgi:hypothetical protein
MLNLMLLRTGTEPNDPDEAARMDRWFLEAREHRPWFVRALAEPAVITAGQRGEPMETTLTRTWELYAFLTGRDPDHFYETFAPDLYLDMFRIGSPPFQEELITWLTEHSSKPDEYLSE